MKPGGKLTKRYFMQIPQGFYLVSNIYVNQMQSAFEEFVCPAKDRINQWQRIVEAGASQRLCRLFDNKAEYEMWMKPIMNKRKNKKKSVH